MCRMGGRGSAPTPTRRVWGSETGGGGDWQKKVEWPMTDQELMWEQEGTAT